jgi:hypothetical protein
MKQHRRDIRKPSLTADLRRLASGLTATVRHNARLIFANRFIYFLLAALAVFLLVIVIYVLEEEAPPEADAVYYILLVPAMMITFYPAVFAIQADIDTRMLETLFGIPNYRYRVWLARYAVQYLVVAALLLILALFSRVALADFNVLTMVFQLMFPIVFLGNLAWAIAAIARSGSATAAIMVTIGLFFWITAEPLEGSRWNLFHNPFSQKEHLDALLWAKITLYNRISLAVGSVLAAMFALLRLQKRESFI